MQPGVQQGVAQACSPSSHHQAGMEEEGRQPMSTLLWAGDNDLLLGFWDPEIAKNGSATPPEPRSASNVTSVQDFYTIKCESIPHF